MDIPWLLCGDLRWHSFLNSFKGIKKIWSNTAGTMPFVMLNFNTYLDLFKSFSKGSLWLFAVGCSKGSYIRTISSRSWLYHPRVVSLDIKWGLHMSLAILSHSWTIVTLHSETRRCQSHKLIKHYLHCEQVCLKSPCPHNHGCCSFRSLVEDALLGLGNARTGQEWHAKLFNLKFHFSFVVSKNLSCTWVPQGEAWCGLCQTCMCLFPWWWNQLHKHTKESMV